MMREQNFLLLGIFSIVILGGLGLSQDAYAEDSSPVTKNPTNFVQSNNNWSSATTTAADTASDDTLCVSATDGNDDISFTGFGFDLPDGATNIFATVNVEVSAQGGASFQLREGTTVLATSGTSPNDSGPTAECSAVESDSVSTSPTAISSVAQAESLNVFVNRGNGNKDVYVNQVSIALTFTEPGPEADLELTKIVDESTPNVGDTITFTITVTNDGPDTATNIEVTDIIPGGLDFTSDNPGQGSYDDNSGLWSVGDLNDGASATLQISGTVTSVEELTNTAEVTAVDQFDPDSTPDNDNAEEDDQDSAVVSPQSADLRLEKTVDDLTPEVDDTITFTITVTNDGPDTATNIEVTDIIPGGLDFTSDNPSQGSYNDNSGLWSVGDLNDGASATLQISGTVTSVEELTNTAEVTAVDQFDPDSTPDNDNAEEDDQDSASVAAKSADLELTKIVDDSTPEVDDTITFTITVTNDGPDTATTIEVTDIIPVGLDFTSDNPSQGSYDDNSGLWSVGDLNKDASATLQISGTVTSANPFTNTAQITAVDQFDPDSTPNNNVIDEDDQDSVNVGSFDPGSIAGLVWDDLNADGIRDDGEPVLADVTVNLLDGDSDLLFATVTDVNGEYQFSELFPGDYIIQGVLPSGFVFTLQDAGADDTLDSDVSSSTGKTDVIALSEAEDLSDVDIGMTIEEPEAEITGRGGDNQWDTRPTFGVSHETREDIVVENGFRFNTLPFTIIDNHWTNFEEQSIDIGLANSFSATVYADKQLKVQEFLFGIPNVGESHLAELGVEIWYDINGEIEDVIVVQKSDVIDPETVSVSHEKTKCLSSDQEAKCDTTTVSMIFLEPLKDKVMAIKAIDFKLRDQRTYLNEGFDISGESLNPMLSKLIPSSVRDEGLVQVTQVAKYSPYWTADDGRMFEMNSFGSFKQINQSFERLQDTGTAYTRAHSGFGGIIAYEQNRALDIFDSSELVSELPESFAYIYPETGQRITDETRQAMLLQEQIAKKILEESYIQARW